MKAIALLLLGLLSLHPSGARAQAVTLIVGSATVQNVAYERSVPTVGLALALPVTGRLSIEASYVRWAGENHNLRHVTDGTSFVHGEVDYHGNQGFGLMARFGVLTWSRLTAGLGAGFSAYQFTRAHDDELLGTVYNPALSLSGSVQWRLLERAALRVELMSSFDEITLAPNGPDLAFVSSDWIFVNVGLGFHF